MSGFTVGDETAIFQMYARAGNVKHSFSTIRAPFAAIYYKEQVFDLWNLFKGEHTYRLVTSRIFIGGDKSISIGWRELDRYSELLQSNSAWSRV